MVFLTPFTKSGLTLGTPILLSLGGLVICTLGVAKALDLYLKFLIVQKSLGLFWRPHAKVRPWMAGVLALRFLAANITMTLTVIHPHLLPPAPTKSEAGQ